MTDSKTSIKETDSTEGAQNGVPTKTATRRSALGLSVAGGLAAFLSACGKYVTKFDKTGLVDAQSRDGEGEVVTPGTGTPKPTVTTGPQPPLPPKPPSKFCFETSKATPVSDADFFVAGAKALYGNKFSSLLAVKVQKGKAWSPAVGDLVHILLKKNATESYLAASRRVRSTDDYSNGSGDGIGLVFESLYLDTFVAIQVVVIKGAQQYIAEMPVTYSVTHNGKPVFDLSLARTDLTKSNQVFGLGFGDSSAPHMGGTSDIGNAETILSPKLLYGGDYVAAKGDSTWDLSNLIPAGTELKNIFGQSMSSSNSLLHEHQSLVVYREAKGTVGGQALDGYLRYFIYVG